MAPGVGPLLTPTPRHRPYYEDLGLAHDELMRCADCQRLITCTDIRAGKGYCQCGTRRFKEVRTLSTWEWLKVWLGIIDFPHRVAFLKEFPR